MIFRRRFFDDGRGKRLVAVIIAPLRDIIILHAINCRALPIARSGERADVGDMDRGEQRRELDHDALAILEVYHHQIVGRDRLPLAWFRFGDDPRRGGIFGGWRGGGQRER